VAIVVSALLRRLATYVSRTMRVFVERESKLKLVATEQIRLSFKPHASAARMRRLLKDLCGCTFSSIGLFASRR